MRPWPIGILALLLPVLAQAQYGKPEPLPPARAAPDPGGKPAPDPGGKPPPLGAGAGVPDAPPPQAPQPAAPSPQGQDQGGRCAPPLASGCLGQQSACQLACPPQWSMNPNAPAFTPTDRAGCMGQCQQRYFACMRLHGCM